MDVESKGDKSKVDDTSSSIAQGSGDGTKNEKTRKKIKGEGKFPRTYPNPPSKGVRRKQPLDNDSKSVVEMGSRKEFETPILRGSYTAGNEVKTCYFYKDGDYRFSGIKVTINPRKLKKMDSLFNELSRKIPRLPFGVRSITTPSGNTRISNLDGLTDEGSYVCSSSRRGCKGLKLENVSSLQAWRSDRPPSGKKLLNYILQDVDVNDPKFVKLRTRYDMSSIYEKAKPKKIKVLENGNPSNFHSLLLNRKTAQTFEQVLKDLSDMFGFAIRKLYTSDGKVISGLNQLIHGQDNVICSNEKKFKPMVADAYMLSDSRARSRATLNTADSDAITNKRKSKANRLSNTKGNWSVAVKTDTDEFAGTQAQVTLVVYGHKGSSGPISLGSGDGSHFQPGNTDNFDISVGTVGEIYKIRICHDNSGDSPGWLCKEVFMRDKDTDEELTFVCKRWLARDKDDCEICRELPAVRKREPTLPIVRYNVDVVTGNLWNGGTDANVYMTIYGDRGDTGVRQLYSADKANIFKQGKTDHFIIEAVTLGRLKKIIVGHDGTSPGLGWYLDRICIKEASDRTTALETNVFHCGKWLDEGEDDGKIVRELHVQREYMDDIIEKRNWEHERWKFEKGCQVEFYSLSSGKAVRAKADGSIDALGGTMDSNVLFNVIHRKVMVRLFNNVANPERFLAIDSGKMTVHTKADIYGEFRIRVQNDRSVMLESVKNPLQFLTFGENGHPSDVRGIIDKEKTRRFFVYCKGMFRHRGVIMFATSLTQCITINPDFTMSATGKKNNPSAHFRVHKKQNERVFLFESMAFPGKYIRLKEGKIDVQGGRDGFSHFLVEKHKSGGYVSLQSSSQRGLYLGMKPDGRVWPTVDTGVNNVYLYPEVIEFGTAKAFSVFSDTEDEKQEKQNMLSPLVSPVSEEILSPTPSIKPGHAVFMAEGVRMKINEGDWSIHITTMEQLKNADVNVVVYGDKGNSGQVALSGPAGKELFLPGNIDEFRTNLSTVGKINKIRLELVPKSSSKLPSWKVKDVKLTDLTTEETLTFSFNRWLARDKDDMDIMREQPAVRKNEESLPVLKYYVMIHTDEEEESGTDSNVYLCIQGDKGDTGKRSLIKSNNKEKFRNGQIDVFEVEAVSLGKLEKCIVGHDGTAAGQGWLLQQIIIRESEDAKEEYIFPCEKWLDVGQEDRRIERVLHVKETKQVMGVEPIEEVEEEETYKEGDWNVWVTTGSEDSMTTSNMVFIYAYGSGGCVGPLKLGSGRDGYFRPGAIDKFKVTFGNETGILYKVRIGHNEAYPDSGWYIEKIRLQDCSSGDEYSFVVNRWLSRSYDDGDIWREFAVAAGGKPALPVLIYTIEVQTGRNDDASTTAGVFICLHGSKGDSGKRKLFKSKSSGSPFQSGSTDVFELEAVSLGDVEKVTVSQDGKGSHPAWFLDNVRVCHSDSKEDKLYFPCNRWLDDQQGDKKCEVELVPQAEPKPEPKASEGEYSVSVKTAEDSKPSNGGKVEITVYGEKGKSDGITLYAPNPSAKLYEPGNIDNFTIQVGDLGELYKIRITREDTSKWEAWHLQEIQMQDTATKEDYTFHCDRWLSREKDDFDINREFPVIGKSRPPEPVVHYEVSVATGNHWAAETDANIYITLCGKKGDFGRRMLYHSNNDVKFQKGQMDTFTFEAVSLEELTEVQIGHDRKGHGAGIYIEEVRVLEVDGPKSSQQYIFPCRSWLDTREGDGKTWRTLQLMDTVDVKQPSQQKPSGKKSKGHWSVVVKTSDIPNAGTHAHVFITGFGTKDKSKRQMLGSGDPDQNIFDIGAVSEIDVNFGNIGDLVKIRLEHDSTNQSSWHVDWLKMTDVDTNEVVTFYINQWFASDQSDGQLVREFPVQRPGDMPLPMSQYVVLVQTGKQSHASASEGRLKINLIGEYGDTGSRQLTNSLLTSSSPLKPGQQDAFIVEAVSVGNLNNIALQFEGQGVSWYLERVTVFERLSAISQTVFNCHTLFDTQSGGPVVSQEFPVSAIQPATCPPEVIAKHFGDIQPLISKGMWTVKVYCGTKSNGGTSDQVHMVVYGIMGQTDPIHLNAKDQFKPGAIVQVDVNVGDIGAIVKVHLYFGGDFTGSSWFLDKLKMKDKDTGQEFHMIYMGVMDCTEENHDGSIELPAIRPDLEPLHNDEFTLYVATGNQPKAETDAEVFCELIGDWGSTGHRVLAKSNNNVSFRQGQVDEFKLKGLDLGKLKEVLIGHHEQGRGRGWFCDRVLVKSTLSLPLKIFPCNRWMDTGSEDRQLVRKLYPLGEMPINSPVAKGKSKGIWTCKVITADEDKLPTVARGRSSKSREVSLVIYGSVAVQGPLTLISSKGEPFLPGQTDEFKALDVGDIGTIQKIRVSAGYEQDPDTVWTIHKVILTDDDTEETFIFDFTRWLGEIGGDIRKELPAIQMGKGFKQVIPYYIEMHTSEEEMDAGTDSHVFITLYGMMADTGRRHLNFDKNSKKFQTGQVDTFIVEAVDLGDLEKIVVAKGPGSPWLVEKIIIKAGQYSANQYVFEHNLWIGSKTTKDRELEQTIRLTREMSSSVAIPASKVKSLPNSKGRWKVTTETGGQKGGDNLDLVIVFSGDHGESELCPLKSTRDNPFQIGQVDNCSINMSTDVGELYKIRLGFLDNTKSKGWFLRMITCEDEDTGDIFSYELGDWIVVDDKTDGWKEIPVVWPAINVPPIMKYQVIVYIGEAHIAGTDADVYVCLFGEFGSTGRRQLKHSLTNSEKFKQEQVDQFEVEAVNLGKLEKVTIGHNKKGAGSGWYLKKVVITESAESIEKFIFPCNHWLDEGEEDGKIERTLLISDESVPDLPTQERSSPTPIPVVKDKSPTPPPQIKEKSPTPPPQVKEKSPPPPQTKEKSPTPPPVILDKSPSPKPAEEENAALESRRSEENTNEQKSQTPVKEQRTESPPQQIAEKSPTPEPEKQTEETPKTETPPPVVPDNVWRVHTVTGSEAGHGTGATVVLILYGDKGMSDPILIGQEDKYRFSEGQTAEHEITLKEDIGQFYKVRVGFHGDNEISWYHDSSLAPSWFLEKLKLEHLKSNAVVEFDANNWIRIDEYNDFWKEFPVKQKENQLSVCNYHVEVWTGDAFKSGTDANVFLQIIGDRGNTGNRKLITSKTNINKFEQNSKDVFEIEAVDLGNLKQVKVGHDGENPGSGWFLEKVVIKESESSKQQYVFNCQRWLDVGEDDQVIERTLDLTEITEVKDEPIKSEPKEGDFKVYVTTSNENNSGTNAQVVLTVYGDADNTGPITLGEPDKGYFETGQTDEFDIRVDAEDIGQIRKIRIEHDNTGFGAGWRVDKVVLVDLFKNETYEFAVNKWLSFNEKPGDISVEVPANQDKDNIWPVRQYVVEIKTGEESNSGTDALVHISLIGTVGDSGRRYLVNNLENDDKFETGKLDTFVVEAVDLGRLETIIIGHDGRGPGSGWLLDKVMIRESFDAKEKYIFSYGGWLEESEDSGIVEVELYMDRVEREDSNLNRNNNADEEGQQMEEPNKMEKEDSNLNRNNNADNENQQKEEPK